MKYVVILEQMKDVKRNKLNKHFSDEYPRRCVEVEAKNLLEVEQKYPNKVIVTTDRYNEMMKELKEMNERAIKISLVESRLDTIKREQGWLKSLYARMFRKKELASK